MKKLEMNITQVLVYNKIKFKFYINLERIIYIEK